MSARIKGSRPPVSSSLSQSSSRSPSPSSGQPYADQEDGGRSGSHSSSNNSSYRSGNLRFARNPQLEFGGPLGVMFILISLPLTAFALNLFCNDIAGCPIPSLLHPLSFDFPRFLSEIGWSSFSIIKSGWWNWNGALFVAAHYLLSLFLYAILPAQVVVGSPLPCGGHVLYRFNAFTSALFSLALAAGGTFIYGRDFPLWSFIYDNHLSIFSNSLILSTVLAIQSYVSSFSIQHPGNPEHRELASGGMSGNLVYDWFVGRELNPSAKLWLVPQIDVKTWMELRPGMMLWILLNLAFMMKQYSNFGYVTISMRFVVVSQLLYVLDALWMERAIITTIDIITDGFGFMLSFGNLVWVPFTFSLQAKYLAVHPVEINMFQGAVIALVIAVGYVVFRRANNEKNRFRVNPNDPRIAHLEYIESENGSKLLVTGWWGTARHINYLADWILSWAYSLPTGLAGYVITTHPTHPAHATVFSKAPDGTVTYVEPGNARGWGMLFTYFYLIYFATLLIHRERRDEEKCRHKYGKTWDEYCKRVPWRIIPYVY